MSHGPWVLPQILIVLVLVFSAVAKVGNTASTISAFHQLKLPGFLVSMKAPRLLPWGELVLAALIVAAPGPWAVAAAAAGLVLMLAYLVVIARAVRFPYPVTCGCFGQLGLGLVEPRTVWRNALLTVIAAASVWTAAERGSVLGQLLEAPASVWWWLLGVLVTIVLTWFIVGGRQQVRYVPAHPHGPGRSQREAPAAPDPAPAAAPGSGDELEYVRVPTPFVELTDLEGNTHQLRDMARREAQLLVFLSPGCGSCEAVAEQMPAWAERLGPVRLRAVLARPVAELTDDEVLAPLLPDALSDGGHLARLLETYGSPAAVLVGADDYLAGGPVVGSQDVREFVDEVIAQLQEDQG